MDKILKWHFPSTSNKGLWSFQYELGWLCPVSSALNNPSQELKNSFCFGYRLITIVVNHYKNWKAKLEIVSCCYYCLDLPWEKFFQVWVTFFPSSWEQEYCVEKKLCKFEAVSREFVTFSRHYSCLKELGKKVTNTWKNFWAWYKSRQL